MFIHQYSAKKMEKKDKKKKKFQINIKNMGVDIDKNEYREIVLSNSSRPEETYKRKR